MELLDAYKKLQSMYPKHDFVCTEDNEKLVKCIIDFFSNEVLGIPTDYHICNAVFKLLKLRLYVKNEFPNKPNAIKDLYKSLRINPYVDIDAGFLKVALSFLADKGIVAYKSSIDWWWVTELGEIYFTVLELWYSLRWDLVNSEYEYSIEE